MVTIVQEAEWAPGPVWSGAENLVLTGTRFPGRPARSQSLYPRSYRGPPIILKSVNFSWRLVHDPFCRFFCEIRNSTIEGTGINMKKIDDLCNIRNNISINNNNYHRSVQTLAQCRALLGWVIGQYVMSVTSKLDSICHVSNIHTLQYMSCQ
jgi:hypothetical protein